MEFSIGDMVMHPTFGPARITGMEDREWVEGFKRYCVLEVPERSMVLRLPVRQLRALGLRPLMSRSKRAQVMRTLAGEAEALPDDANARYHALQEKVRTCRPLKLAALIRDLTWRQQSANLTKRDIDMLDRARSLLTSEIASATESQTEVVGQAIDAVMALAIAANLQETDPNT